MQCMNVCPNRVRVLGTRFKQTHFPNSGLHRYSTSRRRFCRSTSSISSDNTDSKINSSDSDLNGYDNAKWNKTTKSNEVLLELRNVYKSFGEKDILKGASFRIFRGEAVGIIGASGSGKSTTLRLMAGLLAPDKGQILVKGVPRLGLLADRNSVEELRVGMVFQSGALFDSLTVGENVGFLLYEHSHLRKQDIQKLVRNCLAKVGLKDVENLYPSQLSGGMKKRVALARAIVSDRRTNIEQVLMYDEPTAGLDPVASTVVEDLMRSMHGFNNESKSSNGLSISSYIVVTHQHSTIKRAVDRIIFLHDGVVAWEGTTAEFSSTMEPIVRQFATGSLDGPIKIRLRAATNVKHSQFNINLSPQQEVAKRRINDY